MTRSSAEETRNSVKELLDEALACHRAGKLPDAERCYQSILEREGRNAQALTLLGTLYAQSGHFNKAIKLLNFSLKIEPRQPFALNSLGNALNALRRHADAVFIYNKAIALQRDHAAAYCNRGNAFMALNRQSEALASYKKAIALDPNYAEAHGNRGNALSELRRFKDAVASYDKAIALRPDLAETHFKKGLALQAADRPDEALTSYDAAIALDPGFANAYNNRGNVLALLGRFDEALESFGNAIRLAPDHAQAYNNRGSALTQLERHSEALENFEKAIALKPDYAEALNNRGLTLQHLSRLVEALESFDKAIAINGNDAAAHVNRGNVLQRLKRHEAAIASFDKAIKLSPGDARAYHYRGATLKDLNRLDEALETIDKALVLDPACRYAPGARLQIKMQMCDWNKLREESNAVLSAVESGALVSDPFFFLSINSNPALQRKCAELYANAKYPARPMVSVEAKQFHKRIRVAYLSADFRDHAMAFLMAGVFEEHDRDCFEVRAISFGPDDRSSMRSRLEKSFEIFLDVRALNDAAVAALLREAEVDIAVDLTGFTAACRTGIFARRPAPIQVNYLGFPATMGAEYIDYIIADRIVIPKDQQAHYAEKIVYLPDTFQCNDSTRAVPDDTPARSDVKLPAEGFVFCSFNNNYKITPHIFDIWMRLLRQVDGSVLWLVESNPSVARNLRREAEARGIAGERLVFAPRVANPAHLARHRLADLFLDTLPFNAGATASDVLWAGLPLLSCIGESFVGRAAASLLNAIGLPEMVTHSLAEYEALALELARNPAQLAEVKAKLLRHRQTYPLFDTVRFTRHLETAYTRMVERHRSGEPPASFEVEASQDAFELEQVGRVGSL